MFLAEPLLRNQTNQTHMRRLCTHEVGLLCGHNKLTFFDMSSFEEMGKPEKPEQLPHKASDEITPEGGSPQERTEGIRGVVESVQSLMKEFVPVIPYPETSLSEGIANFCKAYTE